MIIENIYPIPIGIMTATKNEVDLINKQYTEFSEVINNVLEPTWGDTVLSSFNSLEDYLSQFNQTSLSNFIDKNVFEFYQKLTDGFVKPGTKDDPYIRQSWINVCRKYGFQERHNHVTRTGYRVGISGVYYTQTSGKDGNLDFFPPDLYERNYPFIYTVEPAVGKLVLFRSELYHRVRANLTECDRISVSFNYKFL